MPQSMGGMAEEFTAQELRRLHRRRWHLANGVLLKKADIDHVAIGPGGVLVVESKYSSSGWEDGRFTNDRLSRAVRQAQGNQHDLLLFLEQVEPRVAVPLSSFAPLSCSGAGPTRPRRWSRTAGVAIVPGPQLRRWLGLLPTRALHPSRSRPHGRRSVSTPPCEIKLSFERLGPPPQSFQDWLFDLGRGVGIAGAGLVAELEAVRATGPAWFPAVGPPSPAWPGAPTS